MKPKRPYQGWRAGAVLVAASAVVTSITSTAAAQAWLPDRAYTEGPGIRAGDLEVHPGIAIRGGYDSNVFRADGDSRRAVNPQGETVDVTQRVRGSGILAVTPHLHLSTLSAQRRTEGEARDAESKPLPPIAFRGGVAATYFHYFLEDAPKNLEIDTDLALSILPQRPFNVDVTFAYVRNVRPFTQFAGDKNAYNFNSVMPRLRLNFGSRSQVLTGYVGYAPRITIYESNAFNYLDNASHGIEGGAAWRFLPSTAAIYDATVDLQEYKEDDSARTISPIVFASNTRFRTRLGLNGAITRTLSLRALAGYAAIAFHDRNDGRVLDDHEDVVGEAVLTWRFGPAQTSQFEVGYNRDLLQSSLGGWTRSDRGYFVLRSLLGRVFLLSLEGGAARLRYGSLWGYDRRTASGTMDTPVALGADGTDRKDVRIDGAIRGEYRVTNWLSIMADVSVLTTITDFDYAVFFGQGAPVPDPARYFALMAFGGIRAHY